MDILSPPAEHTYTVTDLDVSLVGGDTVPLTVQADDTLTISDNGRIDLYVAKTGERIVILASAVRWYSRRERTITVPIVKGETR